MGRSIVHAIYIKPEWIKQADRVVENVTVKVGTGVLSEWIPADETAQGGAVGASRAQIQPACGDRSEIGVNLPF